LLIDQVRRDAVLEAIQEVCAHRGGRLLAARVRSNHVHTLVDAGGPAERAMSGFQAYASRRLNRMRWLWKPRHVPVAVRYVVAEQTIGD
jgi:REP element-mobilizing transposase RayT